jgi:hypothetical protein
MFGHYRITDGEGWWCGMRRDADKRPIHLWSTKRKDAAVLHFFEAAASFQKLIPQATKITNGVA